jgi:aspartyl-tRNA synthetase
MTKLFYTNIKKILYLVLIIQFSCNDKPDRRLQLNIREINNWNSQTVYLLNNCCNKQPAELYILYDMIKLNKRKTILDEFSKYKLQKNIKKIFFYEFQCKDGNYVVTMWYSNDYKKKAYLFSYNYGLDTLICEQVKNDYVIDREWFFEDTCCEAFCPGILSEIYLNKDYSIKNIKIKGYMND